MKKSELLFKGYCIHYSTGADFVPFMPFGHNAHALLPLLQPVYQPQKARQCGRYQENGSILLEYFDVSKPCLYATGNVWAFAKVTATSGYS